VESEKEGNGVWHVKLNDGTYVRDFTDHTNICNQLLEQEINRRGEQMKSW
jgi:hypothetical protein